MYKLFLGFIITWVAVTVSTTLIFHLTVEQVYLYIHLPALAVMLAFIFIIEYTR